MVADLPHILVVDDDDRLRELLRKYLSDNGFIVISATDAANARAKLASLAFDLIVLDLMMPGESGLDFAADLRTTSDVPILMLTAMGEAEDRIRGLEHGADDYLTKPFEPRELLLRVNNILKRAPQRNDVDEAPRMITMGAASFDLDRGVLKVDDRPVRLTTVEVQLLKVLAERPGEPLSRDDLIERTGAGADASGGGRAVDVQVTRLRRKIEADPKLPRYLQTVRGKGYVLMPD
ncbi:response regulator [Magnetovibrio sp.]|uniref:response regulator n=1 Tax=Magnetovibrio sp. TaxID=2024836 RepID=UPI002F956A99